MLRRTALLGMTSVPLLVASGCAIRSEASPAPSLEEAFFYAFPLYEFARTAVGRSGPRGGGINRVAHRATLADHTSRQITAPNNDTIYSSCQMELSGGPVEVISPSDSQRYFSIAFMDAFTDNFAYIGTRATGGRGGRFWVVGPSWKGETPSDVTILRSSTNDVWMLARVLVEGPDDLAAARALQERIEVRSLSTQAPRRFETPVTSLDDPANFLAVVNEVLKRSPGGLGQTARASRFVSLGIGATPAAETLEAWRAFIPEGMKRLRSRSVSAGERIANGWVYPEKGVGEFGKNDALRSSVALGGLAALGEREAMYFQAVADTAGQALSGERAYRWRVPKGGVPARAFWSLTMYQLEPDGRSFLVENEINRFSIGDRTKGLVINSDGAFDVVIQRTRPEGDLAANWLPSPKGSMRLSLRAYLPGEELLERRWAIPPLAPLS
ncbi:MAG: DUF1254 domain-containing protein [Alphaproteobacteria bacterium]|nr:DUF1254 domain-containing protein [Alphaproteobacteria bacterium]